MRSVYKKIIFSVFSLSSIAVCDVIPIDLFDPLVLGEELLQQSLSQNSEPASTREIEKVVSCHPKNQAQRFSVWGSFIYWQPIQSSMDVALKSPFSIDNGYGTSHRKGKIVEMSFDYTPGFKVGAAYCIPKTNWKLFSEYTYLNAHTSLSRHRNPNGFLYARWTQSDLLIENSSSKLSAHWDLKAQFLNAEVGRSFFAGSKWELFPHFGLGAAWFDQEFREQVSLLNPAVLLKIKDTGDSWGLGPRMGLDTKWHVLPYLSLLANISTEILFTRYHLTLKQKGVEDSSIFLTSSNEINAIRPELEMYLGIGSTIYYGKRCRWIKWDAGYDFQVWWNQNMIRWYNDSTYVAIPVGDLAFQGLRVTMSLGF